MTPMRTCRHLPGGKQRARVPIFPPDHPQCEWSGGICAEPDGLDGDVVRSGWSHLWHLGRRLGTRGQGVPPYVVRASSFCRQGVQLLHSRKHSGAVTPHGEVPGWGRHLEDQIPVMGNGHESVQGWPANDGIEWEVTSATSN
jgi:hypothetical protein